ncbi:MAG: RNA polymerase sigma factor [Pseudohongiellaceae bacterium]
MKKSPEHFESLLIPHADACYKTAYRLTGTREDAEDLVQELFIKLYKQFDQWCELEDPAAWIKRVLYNLHIDRYRKKSRTHGFNEKTLCTEDQALDKLESSLPSPAITTENHQRQQRILAALDRLDAEQRLLVTLHLLEGYTLKEIAHRLDTPVGTLKSRLHRCKAQLKNDLNLQPFSKN